MFEHKLFFNLVKDLFKWIEGLKMKVSNRKGPKYERIFYPAALRRNNLYVVKFCAKKLAR